jgi:hypothetical protein
LRQLWQGLPYLPHFSFLQSGLDERHLAAVLLENDKILPFRPLMSFRSHPVATTLGRFRLNFWNLAKVAVPLHRQSDKTSSGRCKTRELIK